MTTEIEHTVTVTVKPSGDPVAPWKVLTVDGTSLGFFTATRLRHGWGIEPPEPTIPVVVNLTQDEIESRASVPLGEALGSLSASSNAFIQACRDLQGELEANE